MSKMRFKKNFAGILSVFMLVFFLAAANVIALQVNYTVEATAMDPANNTITVEQNLTKQCDAECSYSIPSFTLPEGYTITDYKLKYTNTEDFKVYFYSTDAATTQDSDDSIIVEITAAQNETLPPLTCNDNQCEQGCTVCQDNRCHEPGFACFERLEIEKIFPFTVSKGISQINILLKNTGTVDLGTIVIELSGDGIYTLDKIPIEKLVAGDKDYAFVKINATKAGSIDLVIKLYVDGALKNKLVGQLNVQEEKPTAPEINTTALSEKLDMLRANYSMLEQEYVAKNAEGYLVSIVYDKLKEAYGHLSNAQSYLLEGEYKKAEANIEIAENDLTTIKEQLMNAQKKEKTFWDKVRENILYIGSTAAAIVSIFAAYSLIKTSLREQKNRHKGRIIHITRKLQERKKNREKAERKSKAKKKGKKR